MRSLWEWLNPRYVRETQQELADLKAENRRLQLELSRLQAEASRKVETPEPAPGKKALRRRTWPQIRTEIELLTKE